MAEKVVKYVEYIKGKFPQLRIESVNFNLSDGRHSDIVMINDELIFKFSRCDWTVGYLKNECRVMSFVRSYLDLNLPEMEYLGDGVAKGDMLRGEPLCRGEFLRLAPGDQNYVAKQIGTFLRQLHAIPLKAAKYNGVDPVVLDLTREKVLSQLPDMRRKIYPYCDSYLERCIEQSMQPLLANRDFLRYSPCVIHGDPAISRFFCDRETHKTNGVIGFGLSGIGDPAYDFGVMLGTFGESLVRRVAKYYGDISKLIDRARFYADYERLMRAKELSDMIATRDFSNFRLHFTANDIMPVGSGF